jgi:hypothetical protein
MAMYISLEMGWTITWLLTTGGARGFFRLGLIEQEEMLLAGASDYGLADPLQQTAISLSHVSLCQLGFKPSLDDLMVMIVLDEYAERIGPVAVDTQRKIEQVALRRRRKR